VEHAFDLVLNLSSDFAALISTHWKLVVVAVTGANVRDHGKGERFLLERLAGGSASDPSAAPARRMFCDGLRPFGRTPGKQPRDLPSHLSDEIAIILGTSLRIALSDRKSVV